MIPFSVKEVRESPATNVNQVVEYGWNNSTGINLEIEASLLSQSKKLFEDNSSGLLKDWVNTGVNKSSVALSILLSDKDLVLYMEVRSVVLEVYVP
jgi:hypothetical protein